MKFLLLYVYFFHKAVLSAAHCFYDTLRKKPLSARNAQISMGRYDLEDIAEDGAANYNVDNLIVHPDYNDHSIASHDADIAILLSQRQIDYSSYVRPACLWISDNIVDGVKATVIGWGLTESDTLSASLKETSLQIVNQDTCKQDPDFRNIVTPRKICAFGINSIPCKGDSGGGLFIKTKDRWYLRGIVSETLTNFGSKTKCDATKFATYTDVPKFYSWISNYLK